ncbi:MAG: hypothetical protein Q9165_004946 [Trypethelium subeluteriae]
MNSDSKPQDETQPIELQGMEQGSSKLPNYVSATQNNGAETYTPAPNQTGAPQAPRPPPQRIDYQVPFGSEPVPVHCPVCQQKTLSTTEPVMGGITFDLALCERRDRNPRLATTVGDRVAKAVGTIKGLK